VLVIIAFPSSTVEFFAPGFDNEKKDLAVKMLPIAIPAIILLSLSTITNITLNALKKFVVPASAELIFKGLIIAALILLYKQLGIYGIAIGVLAGALGKLLLHLILLRKHLSFKMKQGLQEKESLMQVWYLTWPLLLGVLFSQASGLIDNMFASFLREGSISALSYAKKVVELPVLFFPYIISIVIFPYFSQLAIEKNMDRLKMLFGSTIQVIAVIFIPLSIFIGLFSTEIIRVVFERGAFDQLSTQMTSLPLFIYSFGLLFFAIETILVILFFSMGDTKTPILVGILCVILNLGLTYSLIEKLGYIVIALAYVVQKFSKNIVLLFLLKKKVDYQIVEVLSFLKTIVFASLIFFAVNFYFKKYFFLDIDNKFILVLKTFSTFILSGIVYFVALKVLRFKLPMNALKPNIQSNS
jgi:murein biosynthesis integral membrane protein MurJ